MQFIGYAIATLNERPLIIEYAGEQEFKFNLSMNQFHADEQIEIMDAALNGGMQIAVFTPKGLIGLTDEKIISDVMEWMG